MLTPKEHLENGFSNEIWVKALDLVKHCLQKDTEQTFFKNPEYRQSSYDNWVNALNSAKIDTEFNVIFDNSYTKTSKWERFDSNSGELDISSFISGNYEPFDDYRKRKKNVAAVSILYDNNVHFGDRDKKYMIERHRKVYSIAAECESQNIPCRVIAIGHNEIDEGIFTLFAVVKDYYDPIFPAIWSTFMNNYVTNKYVNNFMDFFIGTHSAGNGSPKKLKDVGRFFPEDEELIIFSEKYLKE